MMNNTERGGRWPDWLLSLRPDQLTRERMRRRIVDEAGAVLRARRTGSWWAVADRWTTRLLPLAAALALVFAGLARWASQTPSVVDMPPTVAELLQSANPNGPPAVLTSATEPGLDQLLNAAVNHDAP